ncbi:MAG TPA: hypothetical protein VMJ32_09165, partial [Pirellulales bacterium]|nr:hypothetical protein [Pirellulales bacterium]
MSALIEQSPSADRLLDTLCQHLISLSWIDSGKESSDPGSSDDLKAFSVSAFVISVRNIWFLVTAGHIINDIESRRQNGRKIISARLIDGIGSSKSFPSIPFDLDNCHCWSIYEQGLDYALIPLLPLYTKQLIAGGVQALDEGAWREVPNDLNGYFLIGFPTQVQTIRIDGNGQSGIVNVELNTPLLQVFPVYDPPEELKKVNDRFYAKVPVIQGEAGGRHSMLTDIDGMSGGPLFGVKQVDD